MATIHRKTEKGQTEIETRSFRLPPRLRTALILVDGQRGDAELHQLIPGDPAAALQALLDGGFIELAAPVGPRSAPPRTPRPQAGAQPAGRAGPARPPAFEQRRRDAIRVLGDQLGPDAEALTLRMERAHDWAQLLPMLRQAERLLRSARGAAAAADFANRFVDMPLG